MKIRRWRRAIIAGWERLVRSRIWRVIALIWITVVSLILLRQALRYTDLAAIVSEWEYSTLGHSLPLLSIFLLILALCAPALIILGLLRRRDRRARRDALEEGQLAIVSRSVLGTETTMLRFLVITASMALFIALVTLVFAFRVPTDAGLRRLVDARNSAQPSEGPTLLHGTVLYRRTATLKQRVLFLQRTTQFAPIIDPRDPSRIRYFAQITPERLNALNRERDNPPFVGVLRRNALPGPVLRLFQYAGFHVAPGYHVLFVSPTAMRWPFFVVALDAAMVCLGLLLLALFQRRRLDRLKQNLGTLVPA